MPSPSGAGLPSDNLSHKLPPPPSHPSLDPTSDRTLRRDTTKLSRQSRYPGSSRTSEDSQSESRRSPSPPRERLDPALVLGEYDRLMIAAGAITAAHSQLIACDQITTCTGTRAVLTFGMIGALLSILFLQCSQHFERYPSRHGRAIVLLSGVPRMLLLMGIVGLAGTLVVETFRMSWGIALTLTGILFFGVFVRLLFSWFRRLS